MISQKQKQIVSRKNQELLGLYTFGLAIKNTFLTVSTFLYILVLIYAIITGHLQLYTTLIPYPYNNIPWCNIAPAHSLEQTEVEIMLSHSHTDEARGVSLIHKELIHFPNAKHRSIAPVLYVCCVMQIKKLYVYIKYICNLCKLAHRRMHWKWIGSLGVFYSSHHPTRKAFIIKNIDSFLAIAMCEEWSVWRRVGNFM